jgi:hypothetical protein
MSGLGIAGVILGIYPVVVHLAKTFKAMKGIKGDELNRKVEMAFMNYE